jgi:hypothetical protein
MRQIHIDALVASRTGDTQYVLSKGLSEERCFAKQRVLNLLKQGYEIQGKYVKGVCRSFYSTADDNIVSSLVHYMQDKFPATQTVLADKSVKSIGLIITESFEHSCEWESGNMKVVLTYIDGSTEKHDSFTLNFDRGNYEALSDLFTFLRVGGWQLKQNTRTEIAMLEMELGLI